MVSRTFQSSRLTEGNHWLPDSTRLEEDGIHFISPKLIGAKEKHISYQAIASIRVESGVLFSDITIETSGGSQSIIMNGLSNSDARKIRDHIRKMQKSATS